VRVEAANMLRRLELAKELTAAEANAAYEDLMQLNMELFSFDPFAERAWELGRFIAHAAIEAAIVSTVVRFFMPADRQEFCGTDYGCNEHRMGTSAYSIA
jgi:hypothetical protein